MASARIPRQPATYANAAIRGQMRQWKEKLADDYRTFDRAFCSADLGLITTDFVRRGSEKGRQRAFEKIRKAFGPGVALEGLRIDGKHPLAIWSILRPRHAVIMDAAPESGLMQDCVTVNYIAVGNLPWLPSDGASKAEGLWTLEVPDHALGRAIERSGLLPTAIIQEAHLNLLALPIELLATTTDSAGALHITPRFLVKAGAGGFAAQIIIGEDISLGGAFMINARADTWLADDMLHDDQMLLVDDGRPGYRLGDGWLMPAPFRRITKNGNKYSVTVASPSPPELIAKPRGNA